MRSISVNRMILSKKTATFWNLALAQEQTRPIPFRPMIGPAQVTDPSLAVLPRREADLFISPINEGQASAVGIGAAARKMPKPNGAPGEHRRSGFRRRPERRADRAGDSLVFRIFHGSWRRPGRPVGGVTDVCDAQIGSEGD